MATGRELIELRNIGVRIAERLQHVDIHSAADLRHVGAVEAHKRVRQAFPGESLPLCYYLYSLEGALRDVHWNEIGDDVKQELKAQV